jgi:cytochrome oxidase assembly protein ShyY1
LITWFDAAVIEQALGEPLPHRIVLLDSRHDAGFEGRDWSPAVMPAATHGAYAFQWFSLALAALIIWLILGFRRTT